MAQLTFGEDFFAVLFSVSLILVFVSVLCSSFSIQETEKKKTEKRDLILTISDLVKNGRFSKDPSETEPGVIKQSALRKKLPQLIKKFRKEGIKARIKIISLNNRVLFKSKELKEDLPQSISLPIIYEKENEFFPANMIIKIGA